MPETISYQPIGTVHSGFTDIASTPVQGAFAAQAKGEIEILPELAAGLKDLESFSHIIVLYHFDRSSGYELVSQPMLQDAAHGIFSMRHFKRPNAIGFSILKLDSVEGSTLKVSGVDILEGTPVLDIKPYIPMFDAVPQASSGWVKVPHMQDIKNETSKRAGGS